MAHNLFKQAAAYRKKHKGMSMPDAVKAVSKKSKPARKKKKAVGRAVSKTTTRIKKRGNKVIRKTRTIKYVSGIAGVSLQKIQQEHSHRSGLERAVLQHQSLLKAKGLPATEKNRIKREIKHYKNAITASNQHIRSLKKSV